MNSFISTLQESDKPAILQHFQHLSAESRRVRFGTPIAQSALESYVQKLNPIRDRLLGIFINGELAAFMHVALACEQTLTWELGVSVAETHRRQGLAAQLLRYTKELAFYQRWHRLEMMHVRDNVAITRLCRKEGLVLRRDGCEYIGIWETAHINALSVEHESPYLMDVLND